MDHRRAFPNLFRAYVPPDGSLRMVFHLGAEFPAHLIGLVKMVAYRGDAYLAIRTPHGWGEPGGKLEPGETYDEAIRREMLEETGMRVKDFSLFGAFHCRALVNAPPDPGLLWPEFYFLWGHGEVERAREPCPTPHERILEVAMAPLDKICGRMAPTPGAGPLLVDLYRLADTLRRRAQPRPPVRPAGARGAGPQ
jgi:8-oxo-dGTP pyrophosphatase MutT (NUDIX family)